jgi:NAD(P)-dependent dehydrogenase (short-subunit alcohol dehydrogenase family)
MQPRRKTILITGANRGIGLGLANKFLAHGHTVIATARNPDGARDLWALEHAYPGSFRILELDVTNASGLQHLRTALAGQAIDVLINNAGYLSNPGSGFAELAPDELHKSFAINATGPLLVTQSVLSNLQAAAQPIMVAISSKMGSITDNSSGGYYAYRMSKTALNMFVRSFSIDYPDITSVTLHPGWVKTDMGGAAAPTTVEESASGLFEVITKLKPVDSGRFIDFLGANVEW